jgi:hypothetical protein
VVPEMISCEPNEINCFVLTDRDPGAALSLVCENKLYCATLPVSFGPGDVLEISIRLGGIDDQNVVALVRLYCRFDFPKGIQWPLDGKDFASFALAPRIGQFQHCRNSFIRVTFRRHSPRYLITSADVIVVYTDDTLCAAELKTKMIGSTISSIDGVTIVRDRKTASCKVQFKGESRSLELAAITRRTRVVLSRVTLQRLVSPLDARLALSMSDPTASRMLVSIISAFASRTHSTRFPPHASAEMHSLLLTGDSGSGKTALVYGAVDEVNKNVFGGISGSGEGMISVEVISSGELLSAGREYSDKELLRRLSGFVARSCCGQPVVVIFDDLDYLYPVRTPSNAHSFSKIEDAMLEVRCFRLLLSLADSNKLLLESACAVF